MPCLNTWSNYEATTINQTRNRDGMAKAVDLRCTIDFVTQHLKLNLFTEINNKDAKVRN